MRPVMSRIAADTRRPSCVLIGLKEISIGNSLPSLRSPKSCSPEPMLRTRGSAKKPSRWPGCFPRNRSGTSLSTDCSTSCSRGRSEEHTSELQSPDHLVCRLLLGKKKNYYHDQLYALIMHLPAINA